MKRKDNNLSGNEFINAKLAKPRKAWVEGH